MKRIILTGGGTAGHVTPNMALVPRLKELGMDIQYIGSYKGIEKQLITEMGLPYHAIASGKLRRYFDLQNFTDPFRVIRGYFQARGLMKKLKPDIIFSKGGFVAVPVVLAAKHMHIPVICHESDLTPGLANKLAIPFATKVCCNFPETVKYLPADKAVLTGSPIRAELRTGDPEKAKAFCGFTEDKPTLLVIGGSLGSANVNAAVRGVLPQLLADFNVVHLCGKDKLDASLEGTAGYVQYEYIKEELPHLFALADIVVSRAGANAICELLDLRKPAILIPLGSNASRGDQILNAESFEKQGFCEVLTEDVLNDALLLETVHKVYENRQKYVQAMEKSELSNAVEKITNLIVAAEK